MTPSPTADCTVGSELFFQPGESDGRDAQSRAAADVRWQGGGALKLAEVILFQLERQRPRLQSLGDQLLFEALCKLAAPLP